MFPPQTSKPQRRTICKTSSFGNRCLALAPNNTGKCTGTTLFVFIAVEQKGRLSREGGGGEKTPLHTHFAELYAVFRMIAQLPFHIGEEGGKICQALYGDFHDDPVLSFCGRNRGTTTACWTLILVYFFGPALLCYSFTSFNNRLLPNLHQHYEKELGLGKQRGLWWALESGGDKERDPALCWVCSDLPLNSEWGSPRPGWLRGMRRALAPTNRGWFHPLFRDTA